jgi:hypothetical protein
VDDRHTLALHRYFIQADQMRQHFVETLRDGPAPFEEMEHVYQWLYQGLWYASLYVVVEGWWQLKLKDPTVDELLTSNYVDLLKRYRNGVFHYQKTYYDDRFVNFMRPSGTPEWVNDLHAAFGRFFLAWFAERRAAKER